jgi:hypothetical protein
MTQPTKNPIPSGNILDQVFNAEKIDEVVNSDNEQYSDRFGIKRFTVTGLAKLVKDLIASISGAGGAANVGLAQGGNIQQAISYITPEMSGIVTGVGNADDDTSAIQWAFNQNLPIVFNPKKVYHINPGVITHVGAVDVKASTATFVSDGPAFEIIDCDGSQWDGGIFVSQTIPWTVVYDAEFNVIESGRLGYGRMPYQDSGVDPNFLYQKIACSLIFRSSDQSVKDGLLVKNIKGSYANIVCAGFKNTVFDNLEIRGGALGAALLILNDCEQPVLSGFGWNAGADTSKGNSFKWGRGTNHIIKNSKFFESRQMGLAIMGSDNIILSDIWTYDNAESGIQTGQYSAAYPQESIISKHITQKGCLSWGNYYDGFDHATVTSGANGPYFEKHLNMIGNQAFNNRATGMVVQGNFLQINNNEFSVNGTHGVSIRDSSVIDVSDNIMYKNGAISGGYGLVVVGTDSLIKDNTIINDETLANSHIVNISVGNQARKIFDVKFITSLISIRSSPTMVIGNGVDLSYTKTTSNGAVTSSGTKSSLVKGDFVAGKTNSEFYDDEFGAVQAWKHPYTGSYLRLGPLDTGRTTNGPFTISYNRGKNTTAPTGYSDNTGIGSTELIFNPTSFMLNIYAANSPITPVVGYSFNTTSVRPTITNFATLGENNYRFKTLYLNSFVISDSGIIPEQTNIADLGSDTKRIRTGYFNALDLSTSPKIGSGEAAVIVQPPTTSTSNGTKGQIAYDSSYIYLCVSANTWMRSPLSSW